MAAELRSSRNSDRVWLEAYISSFSAAENAPVTGRRQGIVASAASPCGAAFHGYGGAREGWGLY